MKKSILTVLFLTLITGLLMAHPPKKVTLTYDKGSNNLKIIALHNVSNITNHYVEKITISVDGKKVKELDFKTQTNQQEQDAEVVVPEIKSGSKVTVKATCNRFGSKSETIKID